MCVSAPRSENGACDADFFYFFTAIHAELCR
jgi:hypothetical protein